MSFFGTNMRLKIYSALLLAFALSFTSCLEVLDDNVEAMGSLVPISVSFDISVEEMVETKSFSLPEIPKPSSEDVYFEVKDKNGEVKYSGKGLWKEELLIPVGKYTVEASYGDNDFGNPAYIGSVSGTVDPYEKEKVTLTLQLLNSLVAVKVAPELASHFEPGDKVLFKSGGHEYESGIGEFCFVPSGTPLSVSLEGINSMGKPSVFTCEYSSPQPRCAYEISCGAPESGLPSINLSIDPDMAWGDRIFILPNSASYSGSISEENKLPFIYEAIPSSSSDWSTAVKAVTENGISVIKGLTQNIEYQVRARAGALVSPVVRLTPKVDGLTITDATHTKTSGELDGTDFTSAFTKPEVIANSIDSWNISLCKSDGTILRGGLGLGLSDGSTIVDVNGWPYLPTGNDEKYIVKASAVMDGNTFTFADLSLNVPSTPDFSLAMTAYTSYDKYVGSNNNQKSVTDANNCEPSTLYNAGAKWGISVNLMKNNNYAKSLVINLDGNTDRTFNVTGDYQDNKYYENISGLGWSAHSLNVSVTFDNKTVSSATQTHYITGLPYTKNFTSDSAVDGWTFVEKAYDKSYSRDYKSGAGYILYYAYTNDYGCNLFSPAFNLPSTVDATYQATYYAGTSLHNSKSYTIYAGVTTGTSLVQNTSTSITEKTYCATGGYNSAQISSNIQLYNQNRICFSHNADLGWGQGSQHYLYFGSLVVKYR